MRFLLILKDIVMAPIVALMNPWSAMHGRIGAGLSSLSIAGLAAWFTFFFLAIAGIGFFIANHWRGGNYVLELRWWVGIIALTFLIPVVVYFTVRFWMQESGERFPDIDHAWQEGLGELARCGFDLQQLPLYLMIGTEDSAKDEQLFEATGLSFRIKRCPAGKNIALRWYVAEDAAFIVLSHVGRLTALARLGQSDTARVKVEVPLGGPTLLSQGTCWPVEDETSFQDDSAIAPPQGYASPYAQAPASTPLSGGHTIDPNQTQLPDMSPAPPSGSAKRSSLVLRPLEREEADLQSRRLVYLCGLINEARRPLCPINGLVAELPLNLIVSDNDTGGMIISNALQSDITTLLTRFGLRFPVFALVTGWHEDLGFQEFMRRMGPEKTSNYKFGKGFGIGDPPLTDQLEALCKQSCRAFEDFIYKLFREPEALSKPGNRALYTMLCKVRRYLLPRLDKIVAEGLGCQEVEDQYERPFVAGCYHVAAGQHEDLRAFVGAVFQGRPENRPVIHVHEDLEWTPACERTNRLLYIAGFSCLLLSVLSIAGSIALLYFGKQS
jgi:hypothetical protein